MQITGVVQVLQEKNEVNGKVLRSPLYSIKLDDGQWYNFGFKDPGCVQHDSIEFSEALAPSSVTRLGELFATIKS